ncbi:hypothetical protein J4447_02155, partial [Candidatus Pacearchaeota archaeon]|nr:hypothetical protein [Candidatus Pacearchaeota archaeon]
RHCANPQDRDTEVRGLWFFGMGANVGVTDYYDPSGSEKRYAGEELIMRARDRLIDEAIKMDGKVLESRILGFINEERAEELGLEDELLEREILGVVYLTLTDSHSVTPRDELFDGGLAGIDRLMAITGAADYDDAEITFNRVYLDPWTRIMKNPLIRVLESLERENEIKAEENNNSRNTRKQKGGRGRRDKR